MPTRNLKRENLLVSYKIAQISKKHMEHLLNQNEELFCEGAWQPIRRVLSAEVSLPVTFLRKRTQLSQ